MTRNITLPLAVHVKGKVSRAGGVGLPDIGASALSDGYSAFDTTTDDSGLYSIVVTPGTYTLYFNDDAGIYGSGYLGSSAAALTITVTTADITKNITLPLAVHLKGKVTHASLGLQDIQVTAALDVDTSLQGFTDADGNYTIAVAPGSYTLEFDDYSGIYASGYYGVSGFTYDQASARTFTVTTADVTANIALSPSTSPAPLPIRPTRPCPISRSAWSAPRTWPSPTTRASTR